MRFEYYSHSKVRTWRRCQKLFDYKYEQGLIRKTAPAALLRGVTIHEMLDARVMGKDPMEALVAYTKVYNELWDEEKEKYPSPEELTSLYHRYVEYYKDDNLDYGGRSEIEVTAEYQGIKFLGIIDKIPQDDAGRTFVLDHKSHKIIPDENNRFSDLQTVLYWWALRERGEETDGVIWDYLRTKPPAVVEVLKKGGLTRRVNLDSDYDTYMKAVIDNELDPADYQEELNRLKGNIFFKRVYLPRPAEELVTNIVEEFFTTAQEIENSTSKVRNMTRDCSSCSYFQLCQAELRGLDGSFIKKQMFTVREPK